MRRVPARVVSLVAALVLAAWPVASTAHVSPTLDIRAPKDGAQVTAGRVQVVITGVGGNGAGLFTLRLDGELLDGDGKTGGTFTTLSVDPNTQAIMHIRVDEGEHELRLTKAFDIDDTGAPQQPIVVRFTAVSGGGSTGIFVIAGLVLAGAVVAVVAVRRRATTAAGGARPASRRAGARAAP